ncbi:MAG: S8 family serine peptidase, partial [Methanosarcinales archaeon]
MLNAKVLNRNNEAYELDIMQAIDWSVSIHTTDVINLSLGISRICDGSCPLCETVDAASEFAMVVAAAGNEGPALDTINCPGNASMAITVGACEKDEILDFSSRGSENKDKPNLVAP